MKTTVEALEDNKVKLSVQVDAAEFEIEVEKAFKKIARDVRLPGFRKGKVPRRVLEARFGTGMARGQALEDSIPEYFYNALSEHEVDIISPPEYEIVSGADSGDVAFDAVVQVRPTITIAGYDSIRIEIASPEPSANEVDERVAAFLAQFSTLESVDRPAIDGDTVTIDITTTVDGEEVEGLTANDYSYRVGTGAVVAELDENLTGAKIGDILEFEADHPDPDEEGRLHFRILVKDVQEQVLPELTDDIVDDATEFTTADEFRDHLGAELRREKAVTADRAWREQAAEALGALVTAEMPRALIDTEVRNRVEDMARRLAGSGIGFEAFLQMTGQKVEDLLEQMREPAAESVRIDMALRALAAAEGLEATDDDVAAEFDKIAEGTGMDVDDLRSQISTPNQLMLFRADISKRKAIDWLLGRVEVVDEAGNPIDTAALEAAAHDHDDDDEHDHDGHDHDHHHDHDHGGHDHDDEEE